MNFNIDYPQCVIIKTNIIKCKQYVTHKIFNNNKNRYINVHNTQNVLNKLNIIYRMKMYFFVIKKNHQFKYFIS